MIIHRMVRQVSLNLAVLTPSGSMCGKVAGLSKAVIEGFGLARGHVRCDGCGLEPSGRKIPDMINLFLKEMTPRLGAAMCLGEELTTASAQKNHQQGPAFSPRSHPF
jgi:hypothetical protein